MNVEDDPADAALIARELRRAGFDPEICRVQTEADFLSHLSPDLDIILSDYSMPEFSGLRALDLLNGRGLEIPFIIVSGTIGEDTAVAAMKQGAWDYLLKDRLARLGPAVSHALEQTRLRREKKQAEQRIREQAALLDEARDSICVNDLDQRILYWNKSAERLYGWPVKEAIGRNANELLCQGAVALTAVKTLIQRGEWHGELQQSTREGRQIVVESRWTLIRDAGGAPKSILVINTDITEAKQAEIRIREQAEMLDLAYEGIIVGDFHTRRISFWNKGAERMYGWCAQEAEGRDIGELVFADASVLDKISGELLTAGESRGEHRHVSKSGKALIVSSSVTLVRDACGEPKSVLLINVDVTEKKDLDARFLRAQRMESIGTLASGVAHDLNNILSPIMMSVPMLRRNLTAKQREEIISTVEMSAQRGADIVKQVLTFGRGLEGEKRPLQVEGLIKEMLKIVRETFPKNIAVESSLAAKMWPVVGDATQLHQVLLNLCVNARDAMPGGGELRLSAANLAMDASYASMLQEATHGPYVLLEVADTGSGMPPEIVERIFDPFFTTKELGHGTGLGLSTVHGIIKSHGGFIKVKTQPGKGTTFQVFLPASPQLDGVAGAIAAHAEIPEGHGEIVLIVDDEEPVRNAARTALEAFGYAVLLAADGAEGLAVFSMSSDRIAIVLTDLMMPHMDGVALIRALRSMVPNMPVIASTGLGEKARLAELREMNVETVLHKPYGAEALLHAIHKTLHPQSKQAQPKNGEST
ncbi:MAG: response regulator [Chthoniobacteraceae bacterium]